MNRVWQWLSVLLLGLWFLPLNAHEMGTSALSIREFTEGQGKLVLKRSRAASGELAPIEFEFTPLCVVHLGEVVWEEDTEVYQHADFACNGPLRNHRLNVTGFVRLSPDLIVQVHTLGQAPFSRVLNPQQPGMVLTEELAVPMPLGQYFTTGIEHIVLGLDHVLFVVALFLLWQKQTQSLSLLLTKLTCFTVGHSLTLALVVLQWLVVSPMLVEAWIALSVLWMAVMLTQPLESIQQGNTVKPNRHWIQGVKHSGTEHGVLLMFGLLHGSGFALSMQDKGFPADALLPALLLFNVGIEVGQVSIVLLLLLCFGLLRKVNLGNAQPLVQARLTWVLTVLTGGFALYWTIERTLPYARLV